jgi:hypothetical protein
MAGSSSTSAELALQLSTRLSKKALVGLEDHEKLASVEHVLRCINEVPGFAGIFLANFGV